MKVLEGGVENSYGMEVLGGGVEYSGGMKVSSMERPVALQHLKLYSSSLLHV